MFQLSPPYTSTTHIPCVSCQKGFAVARELMEANQPGQHRSSDVFVCPRCGADNHRWWQILYPSQSAAGPGNNGIWQRLFSRVPAVGFVPLVGLVLALIGSFFYLSLVWDERTVADLLNAVFLGLFIFIAALIPALLIPEQWYELRLYSHTNRFIPPRSFVDLIPPTWRTGLVHTFIVAVVVPLCFYVILPWGTQQMFNLLEPPTRLDLTNEASESIEPLTKDVPPELRADVVALVEQFETVQEKTRQLEPAVRTTTVNESPTPINRKLLLTWLMFVSLASGTAVTVAALAVQYYVYTIDAQLPKPLFRSMSRMTQVVTWEANRSLKIQGNINRVQWTSVRYNPQGGIDLTGLLRDMPDKDSEGNLIGNTVRAQQYIIRTDLWGNILTARIKDTRVPLTVQDWEQPSAADETAPREALPPALAPAQQPAVPVPGARFQQEGSVIA